jgi:mRNA-degrading endonuclease RelE of RelBE toxin-antitoxin system
MKAEVRITRSFKKAVKPLLKKYASLLRELADLETKLLKNPRTGKSLGKDAYKIRLKIKSKGKGKSGGARVISYLESEIIGIVEATEEMIVVNLITIYDKAEKDTISDYELRQLIKGVEI